ncbi:unnamed protein product [Candidula unifasciata]|uniref:Aquaporin n=1 Tax=Candidula unifasciata TaxID=100452 RepID=A0A8S3ZMI2_9EUPU|nr:unnamed protein product [Candidula unifasciata]
MSEHTALINTNETGFQHRFEAIFEQRLRPCLTELIATAIFVFIGTTAACSSMTVDGVALAHGFTIALLIIGTGSISGAHINPAVTLGVLIGGAIAPIQALLYIVAQLLGAILGAAFSLAVIGYDAYGTCGGGGHVLPAHHTPGQAVFCEILLTALLVSTVLLAAVDSSTKSDLAPLAIGFAVTADILAGAAVSGASMNPARSFGPAVVVHKTEVWSYHWIYWVGPATGAAIAGFIYRLLLAGPEKRIRLQARH